MPRDYRQTRFLLSGARLGDFPADRGAEVAFAGRSNAGKSSAINAITGVANLARVSKVPGRTQHINFFAVDGSRRLVDLPGYGFARVPETVRAGWRELIEGYLTERHSLKGLFVVMDARHPLREADQQMLDWAAQVGLRTHVLLSKADKLGRREAEGVLRAVRGQLAPEVGVQLFSLAGLGLAEARRVLDEWLEM